MTNLFLGLRKSNFHLFLFPFYCCEKALWRKSSKRMKDLFWLTILERKNPPWQGSRAAEVWDHSGRRGTTFLHIQGAEGDNRRWVGFKTWKTAYLDLLPLAKFYFLMVCNLHKVPGASEHMFKHKGLWKTCPFKPGPQPHLTFSFFLKISASFIFPWGFLWKMFILSDIINLNCTDR